jgi:protein-S-isoprenylcysteine O-methyltransferase Ste14
MAWLKKPTWRLGIVYALLAVLIVTARRPTALTLTLGLAPIIIGELVRIWACGHLVKNRRLTTTGPYAYVKNPLYVGTILISAGFCVLCRRWEMLALVAAGFFAYYMPRKKRIEGDRLRKIYGDAYDRFDKAVPDLIPRLTPYRSGDSTRFDSRLVFENSEHGTAISIPIGLALIFLSLWLQAQGLISFPWSSPGG